jgi:hypothetical protein
MQQQTRSSANRNCKQARDEPTGGSMIRFLRLIEQARAPIRADRSGAGTLPTRATRYCEAATSAAGFGWWVFPPTELNLLWTGDSILWQYKNQWLPLTAAQFPNFSATFDSAAPADLAGCAPPFLTVLPEPGTLQIWTGLIVQTIPEWSLLIRPPANLPLPGGYALYEGIVETDRWFGPLFANLRFTRTDVPIRLAEDFPLIQIQPIPQQAYSDETLSAVSLTPNLDGFTAEEWNAYRTCIAEPNTRPNRPFGAYAVATRKRRRTSCPHFASANIRGATDLG